QQCADRGRRQPLAQRRDHAAGDEDVLGRFPLGPRAHGLTRDLQILLLGDTTNDSGRRRGCQSSTIGGGGDLRMGRARPGAESEAPMSKGGYTPIAVEAVVPDHKRRSTSLGARLAILSLACALGPVAAALAWGGWPGRFATALVAMVAV